MSKVGKVRTVACDVGVGGKILLYFCEPEIRDATVALVHAAH